MHDSILIGPLGRCHVTGNAETSSTWCLASNPTQTEDTIIISIEPEPGLRPPNSKSHRKGLRLRGSH